MNTIGAFKKWTESKPYFWLFTIAFFFVFFLVFNFGLDTFKNSRGLASSEETQLEKETSQVVVDNISKVIEGRAAEHSAKPSPQEQFLYGYLQGKYKAVYQNEKFAFLELRKDHQPIEFSANRRLELLRNVQALFVEKGAELKNMESKREPASQVLSYQIFKNKALQGRLEINFTESGELKRISVSE